LNQGVVISDIITCVGRKNGDFIENIKKRTPMAFNYQIF